MPVDSVSPSFGVSYAASDPGAAASGLASVSVYARGPADAGHALARTFTGAGLDGGSFTYAAAEGDGTYSFYSVATDNTGNGTPVDVAAAGRVGLVQVYPGTGFGTGTGEPGGSQLLDPFGGSALADGLFVG